MIIVHANLHVKPEHEQDFLDAVKVLIPASRNEEGNLGYKLTKSTEEENHYIMIELWKDDAATAAHGQSAHFQGFLKQAAGYMAAPMEVEAFVGEAVKR